MEKEVTPDGDYVESFNQGYTIAKDRPELAEKLRTALSGTTKSVGFEDGCKQANFEYEQSLYPQWMKTEVYVEPTQNMKKGKDKDLTKE